MKVRAKIVVDDEWEADSLELARAEAQELAYDISTLNQVNAEVVSVEEASLSRGTCTDCKAQDGPCWCGDTLGCTC